MMKEYDTGVPNMTSGQWLTLLLQILQKSKVLLTESELKQIFFKHFQPKPERFL